MYLSDTIAAVSTPVGEGGIAVKAQPSIHFGRDPAGNQREDFAAKTYQQPVHGLVQRPATESRHCLGQQGLILGLLVAFIAEAMGGQPFLLRRKQTA